MRHSVFTSESVCSGHPDKICDQVSDAILDSALAVDPLARVAVETMVTKNFLALAGEVTVSKKIDYGNVARKMVKKLGYTNPALSFTDQSPMSIHIHTQSPEIARGVDALGAGDQGMMFGYACRETDSLMPLPITLAHQLAQKIDQLRESNTLPYLRPDGKTQVSIRYENGKPTLVEQVVLAVPHTEDVAFDEVKSALYDTVVVPTLSAFDLTYDKKDLIVNGTGVWHIGGPASDTGVTGRKIIVDTYGGMGRIGGGCFSGKDPTKVDRSGAYATRFIAKNIVAHRLADRCEVRLAYYIGAIEPIMLEIETFGTEKKSEAVIRDFIKKILNPSVKGIIDAFDLRRPIYTKTASYGHFGRNEFPWEKIINL